MRALNLVAIAGVSLDLMGQIAFLMLIGVVMKNGILLVDRANQLREEGASAHDAILKACPERLRPVLMTAFAAIFGMIPVALSNSDGAEWRNSLGYLIIGGLASSTILTLLVVPVVFSVFEKLTPRSLRIGKTSPDAAAGMDLEGRPLKT